MESWTTAAPFLGLAGLACSLFLYTYVKKGSVGTQQMAAISEAIHEGAMAFLKREYTILLVFVIAVFALLFAFIGDQTAYAFLYFLFLHFFETSSAFDASALDCRYQSLLLILLWV